MRPACPHHIFCAGAYSAPFAKLSSLQLLATCPPERELRVWIHIDGVDQARTSELRKWLSGPGIEVTDGLFGIEPGQKIHGHWHQIMINRIAKEFADEPWLAFVDADNFLADGRWFRLFDELGKKNVYLISQGSKKTRAATLNGQSFFAVSTKLLAFPPALHNEICDQRSNRDVSALEAIRKEFPDVKITMRRGMDTLVAPALKAQLRGYRCINVSDSIGSSHLGGFSYIRTSRIRNISLKRTSMWLRRLRLNRRVRDLFHELDWDYYLDDAYEERLREMETFVRGSLRFRTLSRWLGPSKDEQKFELIRRSLVG